LIVTSDRQLKRAIANLKSLERKCFGSRQRFAFYEFLDEVLKFYRRLRRKKEAKRAARRIAELFGIRKQQRTHSIRVIIDATSVADEKTKSRWARALRYAWYGRRWWKNLNELFQSNGGTAGCAKEFAALRKREDSRPRIGGTKFVPRLSPIANIRIFKPGQLYVKDGRVFARPDVRETVGTRAAKVTRARFQIL
jgi:hypothetical protein